MKHFLMLLFFIAPWFGSWAAEIENPLEGKTASSKAATARFSKFRNFDVELPNVHAKPEAAPIVAPVGTGISEKITEIQSALQKVRENKLFVGLLTEADLVSLPVGISKDIGGVVYEIVIYRVQLTPQGTLIDVGMGVKFPNTDQELMFGAFNVAFSQERGIGGTSKMALLSDYTVNLSKDIALKFNGTQNGGTTYVNWGCDGYQGMGIDFDMIFSRELIRPADEQGNVMEGQISTHIKANIETWDELIVEVNLPRFRMGEKSDRGFVFTAQDVVYDQSEITNGSVIFPEGYESPDFVDGNRNLWKGLYIRKAEVMMPNDFDKAMNESKDNNTTAAIDSAKMSSQRTVIGVEGLLLDRQGLTGHFYGHNLLSLEKGKLGAGWALSLYKLEVDILTGQFVKADLEGDIQIPTSDSEALLGYEAQILAGGDFHFTAKTNEEMVFTPFGESKLLLTRTELLVEIKGGKFYAMADMDGSMNVKVKSVDAELADIDFQGLKIQTKAPYLTATAFSASSELLEQKLSGKALSIHELNLSAEGEQVGLYVQASISLFQGDADSKEGFGAEGGFTIYGERKSTGWKYKETQISRITLEAHKENVFDLKGTIEILKDDPLYGDVFKGVVEARLGPMDSNGISIEASVMFGRKDGRDYWYADALAVIDQGIPVGPMNIHGFGGGVYYGMRKAGYSPDLANVVQSATGGVYLPDKNSGFGFKAIVVMSIVKKETVFAEATFEMDFLRGGGVRTAAFYGCANIMSVPSTGFGDSDLANMTGSLESEEGAAYQQQLNDDVASMASNCAIIDSNAPIFAGLSLVMDFEQSVFHGELVVSIQAGVVKGGGKAVIHFDQETWYIHIGTNKNPIFLSLLGVQATSYFMLGDGLPDGFDAPREVQEILGKSPKPTEQEGGRNEAALSGGRGVAFGASLKIATGEQTFLIFFADINAGLGFDVMLKDYGSNAVCANTGKQIGIDGWYAQGQMYAYVKAVIGVKVDLRFIKGRYEIIDAGFAALLQLKGPNPVYAYGIIGGRFRILGGLVKGNCSFEFTIGEECQIQGASPLGGIEVIAAMTPADKKEDVNVFSAGQVVFNVPINEEMKLLDPNTNEKKTYRVYLKNQHLRSDKGGEEIYEMIWNEDNTTLVLQPESMLQGQANYVFSVELEFQEKKNGKWVDAGNGEKLSKKVTFKTGDRPDFIEHEYVAYSYPVERQMNFFVDETGNGYMKMNVKGWDYLFAVDDPEKWSVKARFRTTSGEVSYGDVSYSDNNKLISLGIPNNLLTNKIYDLELVHIPNAVMNVDQNVTTTETNVDLGDAAGGEDGTSVTVAKRDATEELESYEEKVVYHSTFRSSNWRTFVSKYESLGIGSGNTGLLPSSGRSQINVYIPTKESETFDEAELRGVYGNNPLISLEVDFNDTFFQQWINPIIYDRYPLFGAQLDWRTESDNYGWLKPKGAVFVGMNNEGLVSLSDTEIENGRIDNHQGFRVYYNASWAIYKDFRDFQTNLEDLADKGQLNVSGEDKERTDYIRLAPQAPDLKIGDYHIIMNYTLPGQKKPSSTYRLKLRNIIQ
ncbi:hypothetical protein V6R21_04395 [Limibacter armeniacum]|uniref:hypothetical protein n=1 Tax=Limibacter armeniacum TaxID=466084 RepID=UPI002FE53F81